MQEAVFILIPPGARAFRILVRALPLEVGDTAATMSDWLRRVVATQPWLGSPRVVRLPFSIEASAGCIAGETTDGLEFACGVVRAESRVYAQALGVKTSDASEIGGVETLYRIAESAEGLVH